MIVIDDEFQNLIPPLSPVERARLEENLREAGRARNPLVVWPVDGKQILLDGHNRYDICTEYGLAYDIHEIQFADRSEAEQWMLKEQLGRRNLDPVVASELRGRLYNSRKATQGGDRKSNGNNCRLNTAEEVAKETGVSERTIRTDAQFAEAIDRVREVVPEIQEKLRSREVSKSEVIQAAARVDVAPEEVAQQLRKPHVTNNSGNMEWYTPANIVEMAAQVMGGIDLDPASCETANQVVKAKKFYTKEQDGLAQKWKGRIWLNPPYSAGLVAQFADKFAEVMRAGHEGIVLVNNATDTGWFQELASVASAICFPSSRVKFLDDSLKPANSPLQGQAVLYSGPNGAKFIEVFSALGMVVKTERHVDSAMWLCLVDGDPLQVADVAKPTVGVDEPLTGFFAFLGQEDAIDEGHRRFTDSDGTVTRDVTAQTVAEFFKEAAGL